MIDIPLTIIPFFPVNKIMTVMKTFLWSCLADGIPNDGVPIEKVVTVSVALTVVYVVFAVAGLVFTAVCLLFTIIFRDKRQATPLHDIFYGS